MKRENVTFVLPFANIFCAIRIYSLGFACVFLTRWWEVAAFIFLSTNFKLKKNDLLYPWLLGALHHGEVKALREPARFSFSSTTRHPTLTRYEKHTKQLLTWASLLCFLIFPLHSLSLYFFPSLLLISHIPWDLRLRRSKYLLNTGKINTPGKRNIFLLHKATDSLLTAGS